MNYFWLESFNFRPPYVVALGLCVYGCHAGLPWACQVSHTAPFLPHNIYVYLYEISAIYFVGCRVTILQITSTLHFGSYCHTVSKNVYQFTLSTKEFKKFNFLPHSPELGICQAAIYCSSLFWGGLFFSWMPFHSSDYFLLNIPFSYWFIQDLYVWMKLGL